MEGAPHGVGVQALDARLTHGAPTPPDIAQLLVKYPADRDAMIARLHTTLGNGFVQEVVAVMNESPSHDLLEHGRVAVQLADGVRRTLFPAYRRAVDAIDPLAAMELARQVVQSIKLAERGRADVERALATPTASHDPDYLELVSIKARLSTELQQLVIELSMQMGAQYFRGAPILGAFEAPHLGKNPSDVLASESGQVVELLGVVQQCRAIAHATTDGQRNLDDANKARIADIVDPWKTRPINFAFLAHVLAEDGIWNQVKTGRRAPTSSSSTTLADTEARALAQAKETGALADVGELDTETLKDLLSPRDDGTQDGSTPQIEDGTATELMEKLAGVAPSARGAIVRQIERMGKLEAVCDHLPWRTVKGLHDSVVPYDFKAADLLRPFYVDKGDARSMHQIYEDKITDLIDERALPQAYGLTVLEELHNFVSGGFERSYSSAFEARERGEITTDKLRSRAGNALGKAAAINVLSTLTGSAAGQFFEGLAKGAGAAESIAHIIGGAAGGVGAGVGGHFAGDVYDQAFNGKPGFDDVGDYMKSAAEGGLMGTILSGVSVGAGRYLAGSKRPIDSFAEQHPHLGATLERIRAAGVFVGHTGTGTIRTTVERLIDLVESGFGGPGPTAFATASGVDVRHLPPSTELDVTLASTNAQPMMTTSGPTNGPQVGVTNVQVVGATGTSGRVNEPVPGLYDSIDPTATPPGWHLDEKTISDPTNPDRVQVTTEVIAPNGTSGWIQRSYDRSTKTVTMENAFLDKVPNWIDAGTPLVPGKGTPTVTFLTLRQMKKLGAAFGDVSTFKMKTIQNIEAVMQIERMQRDGVPLDEAAARTYSVQYATTSIQQSGHEISSVRLDMSHGHRMPIEQLMDHYRTPTTRRQELLSKYQLQPSDVVTISFDIYIDVARHKAAK